MQLLAADIGLFLRTECAQMRSFISEPPQTGSAFTLVTLSHAQSDMFLCRGPLCGLTARFSRTMTFSDPFSGIKRCYADRFYCSVGPALSAR